MMIGFSGLYQVFMLENLPHLCPQGGDEEVWESELCPGRCHGNWYGRSTLDTPVTELLLRHPNPSLSLLQVSKSTQGFHCNSLEANPETACLQTLENPTLPHRMRERHHKITGHMHQRRESASHPAASPPTRATWCCHFRVFKAQMGELVIVINVPSGYLLERPLSALLNWMQTFNCFSSSRNSLRSVFHRHPSSTLCLL